MADASLIEHSVAMAKHTGLAHAELVKLRASGLNARQMAALGGLESHLSAVAEANASMGEMARREHDAIAADKRARALPV